MTVATGLVEVQYGHLHGVAAQRVTMRCKHGQSTSFLLPGRDPAANEAAVDVLWVRHTGQHGCECERTGPIGRNGRFE